MQIFKNEIHSKIYFWSLVLLVMSIPLSEFMMSFSQIILLLNWILEGNFSKKRSILKNRKSLLIFISIFAVHLIGIIYSDNISYWFKDVRNKLPLLIIPLIIGTSESLSLKNIKTIFIFFYLALLAGTFASLGVVFGFIETDYKTFRDISVFISHIRFALLLNVGIFSLFYFSRLKNEILSKFEKIYFRIFIIWFTIFLFILNSLTGIIILIIITLSIFIYNFFHKSKLIVKIAFLSIAFISISAPIYYISNIYNDFYGNIETNLQNLETQTAQGNYYYHDTLHLDIENGNYTNIYVCEKEMQTEWNKRSIIAYKEKDKRGNDIRFTLRRYLTSKGLRKDAQGVDSLNTKDIDAIERGIANHLYIKKSKLYKRIHQTIWEIDSYLRGGNPTGHSLVQRVEFLKTSFGIISENFWIGVGNGDIMDEFETYYQKSNTRLEESSRLKSHNQLVLFFVAFGIIGFLYILFAIFAPFIIEKPKLNLLFKIFLTIAIFSMLNEDTLETQAGVTFFAFFYSLLLFGYKNSDAKNLN